MKSFLLLLKMDLTAAWNGLRSEGWKKENGKTDWGKTALYGFALLSLAALAGMMIWLEVSLYDVLAAVGLEQLLIGLAVLLSTVVTLIFGIPQTLAALYFNKDSVSLAHLPFSSRTVMAARWVKVYLMELLTTLVFVLPLVILHGLRVGGILDWLRGLITLLILPACPMALCLLLAGILGHLTSLTRHKEAWVAVGSICMVALVLSLEWTIMPRIPDDADAAYFLQLMTDNQALLNLLIGAFPPVLWTVKAIAGSWLHGVLLVAVSVAAVAGMFFLLGPGYLSTCLRHTEQVRKRTARRRQTGEFVPRSPLSAIFHREMKEILLSPTYLINSVVGVLMPAIMLMGASVGMSSSEGGGEAMSMLLAAWNGFSPIDQTLMMAAVLSLLCWIDPLPATAISREGKRLQITRMIPVKPGTIIYGKLLVSLVVNGVGAALMCTAAVALLGMAYLPQALGAFVLVNLFSYAVSVVNMAADAVKPSFHWKTEQEAIKQNLNSMVGMVFSTAMLALLIAPPLIWMDATTPLVRLAMTAATLAVFAAVSCWILHRLIVPRYAKLEP